MNVNEMIEKSGKPYLYPDSGDWERHYERLAEVMKASAHPVRLHIIALLDGNEVSVGGLQDQLEIPYSVISHHLAFLRRARVVTWRRIGTNVLYALNDNRLVPVITKVD